VSCAPPERSGSSARGIGREGLLPFLESKTVLLDGPTARYQDTEL
jgi:hypothetical protein